METGWWGGLEKGNVQVMQRTWSITGCLSTINIGMFATCFGKVVKSNINCCILFDIFHYLYTLPIVFSVTKYDVCICLVVV